MFWEWGVQWLRYLSQWWAASWAKGIELEIAIEASHPCSVKIATPPSYLSPSVAHGSLHQFQNPQWNNVNQNFKTRLHFSVLGFFGVFCCLLPQMFLRCASPLCCPLNLQGETQPSTYKYGGKHLKHSHRNLPFKRCIKLEDRLNSD